MAGVSSTRRRAKTHQSVRTKGNMRSIEVIVSPEGEVKIEAVGYKGQGCEKATAALEAAMGIPGTRKKKPEYQAQETQKCSA